MTEADPTPVIAPPRPPADIYTRSVLWSALQRTPKRQIVPRLKTP